jgi:hypothetical protein
MIELFANNAQTQLAAGISSSATTILLTTGTGALFPNPTAGQFFSLTLNDAATGEVYEITYCTARTGDSCTVIRGQEGTTAVSWLLGDFAYNALTAAAWQLLPRIGCTGNFTLYVSTSGSDTANTGLTSGSPFATFNKAYSVLQSQYDGRGFTATIQGANATYVQSLNIGAPLIGFTSLTLLGNPASPGSCNISVTAANSSCVGIETSLPLLINGFVLAQFSTGTGACINAQSGAIVTFENIIFGGSANYDIQSASGAIISAVGPYSLANGSGGGQGHMHAHAGGVISNGSTVTVGTGITFSAGVAVADECGVIEALGMAFTNGVTGPNYKVSTAGGINTNGGGPNFFPGSTPGTETAPGWYV